MNTYNPLIINRIDFNMRSNDEFNYNADFEGWCLDRVAQTSTEIHPGKMWWSFHHRSPQVMAKFTWGSAKTNEGNGFKMW